ncbi:TatD family hydrolase [Zoogloea sp.]|uniref:TatD family hydrolase n=1 Tax=Zoogloea sp. TaxID=49181 RepID=UPI001D571429|nr:TatD family hydrolase [Zoogloea sp.]MBK6653384.1 TatD family hydrolase [Zoogloea sp.]MBK7847198.1 TatD family hydrolase [Zoogloea sp.]HOY00925.1 TatD family hydrolase [Zoogloea sp.]HPI60946.1 TatD family hydrolase [Zoogloea sp.]
MLVDSHCHLDFPDLIENEADVLERMIENGVTHALCVSVKLETLPAVIGLAERHANLFASVGVHPDNADCEEPDEARLLALAAHPKVVAIGETGLDYYWHKDAPEWQRARFRTHIRAARRCAKPLIIHTRDSAADTLRLMREEGADQAGGVMHCFTETREVAADALDLGFHISFSGIVSFKNAEALRDVARFVPSDRLLVETDAPYLAPMPFRGKTNQPAYVRHVAQAVADARGESLARVAEATSRNFFRLFKDASPS